MDTYVLHHRQNQIEDDTIDDAGDSDKVFLDNFAILQHIIVSKCLDAAHANKSYVVTCSYLRHSPPSPPPPPPPVLNNDIVCIQCARTHTNDGVRRKLNIDDCENESEDVDGEWKVL